MITTSKITVALSAIPLTLLMGCGPASSENGTSKAGAATGGYGRLKREDFNRRAAEKFLPLFWREDSNKDGVLQPNELVVLWGYGDTDPRHWAADGQFTPQFNDAYQIMLQPDAAPPDEQRHKLVLEELAQGQPTLVETDLTHETPAVASTVRHLMRTGVIIERL